MDQPVDIQQILIDTIKTGKLADVKDAIANGAAANTANENGELPLNIAIQSGSLPICRCLLANGAHPNQADAEKNTGLMILAESGQDRLYDTFMAIDDLDLMVKNRDGRTATDLCRSSRYNWDLLRKIMQYAQTHAIIDAEEARLLEDARNNNPIFNAEKVRQAVLKIGFTRVKHIFPRLDPDAEWEAVQEVYQDVELKKLRQNFLAQVLQQYQSIDLEQAITQSLPTQCDLEHYWDTGDFNDNLRDWIVEASCKKSTGFVEPWLQFLALVYDAGVHPYHQKRAHRWAPRWMVLLSPMLTIDEQFTVFDRAELLPDTSGLCMQQLLVLGAYGLPLLNRMLKTAMGDLTGGNYWESTNTITPGPGVTLARITTILNPCLDYAAKHYGGLEALVGAVDDVARPWFAHEGLVRFIKNQPGYWGRLQEVLIDYDLLPADLPNNDDEQSWAVLFEFVSQPGHDNLVEKLIAHERLRYVSERAKRLQQLALSIPSRLHYLLEHQLLGPAHIRFIDDESMLLQIVDNGDGDVRIGAIERLNPGRLAEFMDRLEAYPNEFVLGWRYRIIELEPDILNTLWQATQEKARAVLLEQLAYHIEKASDGVFSRIFRQWYEDNPAVNDAALAAVIRDGDYEIWQLVRFWDLAGGASHKAIMKAFEYHFDEYWGYDKEQLLNISMLQLGRRVLSAFPQLFKTWNAKWFPGLLIYLTEECLDVAMELVPQRLKTDASFKYVHHGLANLEPEKVMALGWLTAKKKVLRMAAARGLIENETKEVIPYLKQGLELAKSDEALKGLFISRLEELGESVSGADELQGKDLDALAAYAQGKLNKRQLDKINKWWPPALNDLEVDVGLLQWALLMAQTSDSEALPRSTRAVMVQMPLARQRELVQILMQVWWEKGGVAEFKWILKLLQDYGDDAYVDALVEGINAWNKRAAIKAVNAIDGLAAIDTPYALSYVEEICKKSKYNYSLKERATQTLKKAAERRGISVLELYDELVPDFGLGEHGLELDVGPRKYLVKLMPDLSLRVVNEQGKTTKSLPKAKADEDADLRAVAEGEFKKLRSNVKKVLKQLSPRMEEALVCNKTWQYPRWKKLFIDHGLFRLLGQSLIWVIVDDDSSCPAAGTSFRIGEDLSYIDANDVPVKLSEAATIGLWHPLESSEEQIGSWRNHIRDYELMPLVEQVDAPVNRLEEQELTEKTLKRFENTQAQWGDFKRKMAKWNYTVRDGDGSHIFAYHKTFPIAGINVDMSVEDAELYNHFDDSVGIGRVSFYKIDPDDHYNFEELRNDQVPVRLMSQVIAQLEELTES